MLRSSLREAESTNVVSRKPSFGLNFSDELIESLRDFFLRRGGAMGPAVFFRLSVVFE